MHGTSLGVSVGPTLRGQATSARSRSPPASFPLSSTIEESDGNPYAAPASLSEPSSKSARSIPLGPIVFSLVLMLAWPIGGLSAFALLAMLVDLSSLGASQRPVQFVLMFVALFGFLFVPPLRGLRAKRRGRRPEATAWFLGSALTFAFALLACLARYLLARALQ